MPLPSAGQRRHRGHPGVPCPAQPSQDAMQRRYPLRRRRGLARGGGPGLADDFQMRRRERAFWRQVLASPPPAAREANGPVRCLLSCKCPSPLSLLRLVPAAVARHMTSQFCPLCKWKSAGCFARVVAYLVGACGLSPPLARCRSKGRDCNRPEKVFQKRIRENYPALHGGAPQARLHRAWCRCERTAYPYACNPIGCR